MKTYYRTLKVSSKNRIICCFFSLCFDGKLMLAVDTLCSVAKETPKHQELMLSRTVSVAEIFN